MIKQIIILILFIIPLILQGQETRVNLSGFEEIDVKLKYQLMNKVKSDFPFYSESENWPENFVDFFHFIDIDNDSDYDLIYDGWSGSEPMMINVYLNEKGHFSLKFIQYMHITDIEIENNELKRLVIHDPGCCAAIMENCYTYHFNSYSDSIDYWLVDYFTYHNETPKPEKLFDKEIKFEVVNSKYHLRIKPEVDNETLYFPDDTQGNQLMTYTTGDFGCAMAEKLDSTGRIWWYVAMDNKENRYSNIKDPAAFSPKYVGWMSSRYLKIRK